MKELFENLANFFDRRTKPVRRWYSYRVLRSRMGKELRALDSAMNFWPDCDIAFEIVKTQARRPDSDILFAPKSGEFYITNGDQYIIMTAHTVSIINGIYHYDVPMSNESTMYLDKYLKRIVERRRREVKKFMQSKIDNSLMDILNTVRTDAKGYNKDAPKGHKH